MSITVLIGISQNPSLKCFMVTDTQTCLKLVHRGQKNQQKPIAN